MLGVTKTHFSLYHNKTHPNMQPNTFSNVNCSASLSLLYSISLNSQCKIMV